jgi:putative tryptophan/tyrosine transport system substrate-binding protein
MLRCTAPYGQYDKVRSLESQMKRREFITLIGGAVAWPVTSRGQQRSAYVAVFSYQKENDPAAKSYNEIWLKRLAEFGWSQDRNLKIAYRYTGGNAALVRQYAAELAASGVEVVLVAGGFQVGSLQQVTRTLPIVFVEVSDAIGTGFVQSLARPGGNATGFTHFEFDISGKWLELLKQIAPNMTNIAVLRDSKNSAGNAQFGVIQALARMHGVAEVRPVDLQGPSEIERAIVEFAREPNGGLIVTPNGLAIINRELIIDLAARYKLPAIYPFRFFVESGGLLAYGPDVADQYWRAAAYVDRILKGAKPGELPVEQSAKLDLSLNVKTAKALGITAPPTLLARADAVFE